MTKIIEIDADRLYHKMTVLDDNNLKDGDFLPSYQFIPVMTSVQNGDFPSVELPVVSGDGGDGVTSGPERYYKVIISDKGIKKEAYIPLYTIDESNPYENNNNFHTGAG